MIRHPRVFIVSNVIGLAETEKAVQVELPHEGPTWVPKEALSQGSEVRHTGDTGRLVLRRKWARNQGWI